MLPMARGIGEEDTRLLFVALYYAVWSSFSCIIFYLLLGFVSKLVTSLEIHESKFTKHLNYAIIA